MSNKEQLLAIIRQSNLVSDETLALLSQRMEKTSGRITLRSAVKWLIDKGHITSAQGQRLLAVSPESGPPPAPAPTPARPPASATISEDADDLYLAPLDDDKPPRPKPSAGAAPAPPTGDFEIFADAPPAPRAAPPAPREVTLAPLDEPPAQRFEQASGSKARWAAPPDAEPLTARQAPDPPKKQSSPKRPSAPRRAVDDLFAEAGLSAADPVERAESPRAVRRAEKQKSVWDSPLLLIGGGSLLLLVIIGGALYWALNRETGDQALAQAEAEYKAGANAHAITKFEYYLENYPSHIGASQARVHLGMANMRQAVEKGRDWPEVLKTTKEILAAIASEEQFADAKNELAALLPAISEGLASQAAKSPDRRLVEQAREALQLVDKYVPSSMRPTQKLIDVDSSLAMTSVALDRDQRLKETVSTMRQSIGKKGSGSQAAYQARQQLLKAYPELVDNSTLAETVLAVSKHDRDAVRVVDKPQSALVGEDPPASVASVVLTEQGGKSAAGVEGHVVFALAQGAVYALDATTGAVLWRRFVGLDTTSLPQSVTADPTSDVLIVDGEKRQLMRLAAQTGEVRWRQPLDRAASPDATFGCQVALDGDRVLASTAAGRLMLFDAGNGERSASLEFPQGLEVAASLGANRTLAYQLASHSNLFVLSLDKHQCREVLYLGFEPGAVRVSPVVVSRYILVAENRGTEDSVLRVLLADEQGLNVQEIHQEPLEGQVFAAMETAGRTIVVATDRGAVYAFEMASPGQGSPLTKVAEKPPENGPAAIRFALLRGPQLWIAGRDVTAYDIQSASGRLGPRWVMDPGDSFQQPLQTLGKVVFLVRQKQGTPGVLVSAVNEDDGQTIWETRLGVPLAGEPLVDPTSDAITAVTACGGIFDIQAAELSGQAVHVGPLDVEGHEPFGADAVTSLLAGSALAVGASGQARMMTAGPPGERAPQWLRLPGALAASPVRFGQGLIAACRIGQVYVVHPTTGRNMFEPFQPHIQTGVEYGWSRPLAWGDNNLLVADGRGGLYRLGIETNPAPARLVELARADLAPPATASLENGSLENGSPATGSPATGSLVTGSLAALAKTLYAVDGAGRLRSFALPDLAAGADWQLDGSVAWGPARVGSHVLVSTTRDELLCLDDSQQLVWKVPLSHGGLAGTPLAVERGLIIASIRGQVYFVAGKNGSAGEPIDAEQPLGSGPIQVGDRLLVAGHDGTLLVLPKRVDREPGEERGPWTVNREP